MQVVNLGVIAWPPIMIGEKFIENLVIFKINKKYLKKIITKMLTPAQLQATTAVPP